MLEILKLSSIEDIDAQIAALKMLKRNLNNASRTPRTSKKKIEKPIKKTRQIVCSHCGRTDSRNNMERISKYEYQHPMCLYSPKKTVKVEFTFGQ